MSKNRVIASYDLCVEDKIIYLGSIDSLSFLHEIQ